MADKTTLPEQKKAASLQDLFKSLYDKITLGIVIVDQGGALLYANKGFTALTGYPLEEVRHLDDWYPKAYPDPEYRSRVMTDWEADEKARERVRERMITCKNGDVKFVEFRIAFMDDDKTIVTMADTTDRKRTETALKKSEARYRTMWENTGTAALTIQADTTISMVNAEYEKWSGLPRQEIEGKMSWTEFVVSEDLEAMRRYHNERRKKDGSPPSRYEFDFIDKSGNIKHVVNTVSLIPGTKDSISSLIDISERRAAEERLRESEEFYTRLIATLPDIVVRTDMEGNVLFINDVVLEISGYAPDDLVGRNMLTFIAPEDRERAVNNSVLMLEKRLGPQTYHMVMKDGTRRIFEVNGDVLRKTDQTPYGIVHALRDITEQKNLERQLIHAYKMEALGTLAGGIAHDFNNILSAIIGYSELSVAETTPGTVLNGNLRKVIKAGERARELVQQILAFSRQSDQELQPVKIAPILKEVLKFIRASIPTTIEIVQEVESDATVLADPTQMHQVLMNLCTNAAHAMEDKGGVLTLMLNEEKGEIPGRIDHDPGDQSQSDRYLEISVADTGAGIPPDALPRIYDPFYTTKKPGKGTGMGLAVVHGIVESHGGTIAVTSVPEAGTTFTLRLPVIETRTADRADAQTPLPMGREKVLIVDDEPFQLDIGRQILEKLGYHVITCSGSLELLEVFQKNPDAYDLVITDMTMPEMTGDLLAAKVKQLRPDIPVILCTGFSEKITDDTDLSNLHVDALLMKPVLAVDLANTIRKVLDT